MTKYQIKTFTVTFPPKLLNGSVCNAYLFCRQRFVSSFLTFGGGNCKIIVEEE